MHLYNYYFVDVMHQQVQIYIQTRFESTNLLSPFCQQSWGVFFCVVPKSVGMAWYDFTNDIFAIAGTSDDDSSI